jgi:hypothetical protein
MGGGNQLYGQGIYTGYTGKSWIEEGKVFCKYADYEDVAPDHAFYQDYQLVAKTVEVTDCQIIEQWFKKGILTESFRGDRP